MQDYFEAVDTDDDPADEIEEPEPSPSSIGANESSWMSTSKPEDFEEYDLLPGAKDDNYFIPSSTKPMDIGFPQEVEILGEAIKTC